MSTARMNHYQGPQTDTASTGSGFKLQAYPDCGRKAILPGRCCVCAIYG